MLLPSLALGDDEVTRMVPSHKEDLGTGGGVDNLTPPCRDHSGGGCWGDDGYRCASTVRLSQM